MSFGILRIRKIKDKHDLRKALEHNHRATEHVKSKHNINREAIKDNMSVIDKSDSIEKDIDNTKHQKNSVLAYEIIITSDKAFYEKLTEEQLKEYVVDNIHFLNSNFGTEQDKDNIYSLQVHRDEETTHIHALIVPKYTSLKKPRGKKNQEPKLVTELSSRHYTGDKGSYRRLQEAYYSDVGLKYGLERGIVVDTEEAKQEARKQGLTLNQYYKQKAKDMEYLQEYIEQVAKERGKAIDDRQNQRERELNAREEALRKANIELEFKEQTFREYVVQVEQRELLVEDKEKALAFRERALEISSKGGLRDKQQVLQNKQVKRNDYTIDR